MLHHWFSVLLCKQFTKAGFGIAYFWLLMPFSWEVDRGCLVTIAYQKTFDKLVQIWVSFWQQPPTCFKSCCGFLAAILNPASAVKHQQFQIKPSLQTSWIICELEMASKAPNSPVSVFFTSRQPRETGWLKQSSSDHFCWCRRIRCCHLSMFH